MGGAGSALVIKLVTGSLLSASVCHFLKNSFDVYIDIEPINYKPLGTTIFISHSYTIYVDDLEEAVRSKILKFEEM